MRNKELIANVPSISCVENYFLGWCAEKWISAEILYSNTYLPVNEILSDFIHNSAKFESYNKIERIMTVAERHGFVRHNATGEINFDYIDVLIPDSLVLVEVNDKFFKDISLKPWRDDHYIWLTGKTDNEYLYLNNYPLSAGEISTEKLSEVYGGKTLVYSRRMYRYSSGGFFAKGDLEKQICKIANAEHSDFTLPEDTNLKALRDAVGILKITRRRLADWFKVIADKGLCTDARQLIQAVEDCCADMNGFYVRLEAGILRKKFDLDKAREGVANIICRERELSGCCRTAV